MLTVMLIVLSAQQPTVAEPLVETDGTQRWSILAKPCVDAPGDDADIVVCGSRDQAFRLPLPGERPPPNRPLPSNPDRSTRTAMALEGAPCPARMEGCTTGVDIFGGATFLVRAVGKLVDPDSCCEEPGEATSPGLLLRDVGSALGIGPKREKVEGERVPIPLDDPAE